MKLLILVNNPDRAGFRQRIGSYLDIFRQAGIEPTIAVIDCSLLKRILLYRRADQYDVVLLHKKCLNWLDGLFFNPRKAGVLFTYDDAVMLNDKGLETPTHERRFRRSVQKADQVLVGSGYLADKARRYHARIQILPLGLNTADYGPAHIDKSRDSNIRLVWIGSAATLDYIRELTPVLQRLGGRFGNLAVRLIGDEFIDIEGVVVEKIPWKRETRAQALAECDIGLAPLPDTPFTRGKCSFKVLEYSASGLPVVASPIGTNAEHVQDGKTGFLANSAEQWFEKLSLLIEDAALRKEMGLKGLDFAKKHDISVIGQKLCAIIRDLAS